MRDSEPPISWIYDISRMSKSGPQSDVLISSQMGVKVMEGQDSGE